MPDIPQIVLQPVTITQSASHNFILLGVQHILIFNQAGTTPICIASNTFEVSHDAQHNIIVEFVNQSVNINQTLVHQGPILESAEHSLSFDQAMITNIQGVVTTLDIQQDIFLVGPITIPEIIHRPVITQGPVSAGSILSVSVETPLVITHQVQRVITAEASNILTFSQFIDTSIGIETVVDIQQTVVAIASINPITEIEIVQTVDYDLIANLSASNSITVSQTAIANVLKVPQSGSGSTPPPACVYDPKIDDSGPKDTPDPNAPVLTEEVDVAFTFPFEDPHLFVNLKLPEFSDTLRASYQRILRESRGGSQKVYRADFWPRTKTLTLPFEGITKAQSENVLRLFRESLGLEIGLRDFEGREWKGFITNPQTEVTEAKKDRFDVTVEFQGELV